MEDWLTQINLFLMKTGFVEVVGGAGLLLGNTLVFNARYINMWSGNVGNVSIPNPLTRAQWNEVLLFWKHGFNCIFIITQDFVQPLWLAKKRFKGPYARKLIASSPEVPYTRDDSHVGQKSSLEILTKWKKASLNVTEMMSKARVFVIS